MITPDELAKLPEHERAALMRALIALDRSMDPLTDPRNRHRRRGFLTFLLCACLFLIPWIVFLAVTLPVHYAAGQWQVAWTGFDVGLLVLLAATAWAVWRKRQLAIVFALVTGTLLVCDAWFDITLSWGGPDLWVAVATALLGELPMAGLMFLLSGRLLHFTVHIVWSHLGFEGPVPPIWRIRLFTLIADPPGE